MHWGEYILLRGFYFVLKVGYFVLNEFFPPYTRQKPIYRFRLLSKSRDAANICL